MSHTPGPWIDTQPSGGFADIKDANGDLVLAIYCPSLGMKGKYKANFRLAVAAPELLEALESAHDALAELAEQAPNLEITLSDSDFRAINQARLAIAKARGEA